MHKTLTLILASYNMEQYLFRCIDSLGIDALNDVKLPDDGALADRLEVLIINDGSSDKTSEIAHELEAKYPGTVRAIDKPNGHYGSCVNRGLAEAAGTFIKLLDPDDTFDSTAFQSYLRFLVEACETGSGEEIDLVISDFQKIDCEGKAYDICRSFPYPTDCAFEIDVLARNKFSYFLMPAIAYRTERLRKMRYRQTEGVLYSDTEWVLIPLCLVRKARYFPVRLYLYSMGREGQSMEAVAYRKNIAQLVTVKRNIVAWIAKQSEYASTINRDTVQSFVVNTVNNLYISFFLEHSAVEIDDLLRGFDKELKQLDRDLYGRLRSLTLPSRHGFHYIRFWQDHQWSNKIVGGYLRCYSPLARWAGSLLARN